MNNAKDISAERWFAMTRLDENRAKFQLALRAGVDVTKVSNLAIWGNHSVTQYPDFYNARIDGKPAATVIGNDDWLKSTFIPTVQKRGAAVIGARGSSSAASAANAIVNTVQSIVEPTKEGDWHSVAICSNGEYGVDKGLISSFPVRSDGAKVAVVKGLEIAEFSRSKIDQSVAELKEERELVSELLR
jgi:malate dehydrogenase